MLPDGFAYLLQTFLKKSLVKVSATAGSKPGSEAVMCKYSKSEDIHIPRTEFSTVLADGFVYFSKTFF